MAHGTWHVAHGTRRLLLRQEAGDSLRNCEVRIQVIIIIIVIIIIVLCCMHLCCICVFLPDEGFRHNVRASVWVVWGSVPDTGKIIIVSETSRPALGPTQPPIQWLPAFCPRSKAAGA